LLAAAAPHAAPTPNRMSQRLQSSATDRRVLLPLDVAAKQIEIDPMAAVRHISSSE
jgi:hypothetical protein